MCIFVVVFYKGCKSGWKFMLIEGKKTQATFFSVSFNLNVVLLKSKCKPDNLRIAKFNLHVCTGTD